MRTIILIHCNKSYMDAFGAILGDINVIWTQHWHAAVVTLIIEKATKWLKYREHQQLGCDEQRMIYISGGLERYRRISHHAPQNGWQFKTYILVISRIFHVIFLDHSWRQVTKGIAKTWIRGNIVFSGSKIHSCGYRTNRFYTSLVKLTESYVS